MKASELRFNNWVLNGFGEPIQVKDIISDGNTSGYKLSTLKPIPLTPEMFSMLGFSMAFSSDPQEVNASKVYELNGFNVHQHNESENVFEVYNYNTHELIRVEYLHHLQNLYYYSFNEPSELTINLK